MSKRWASVMALAPRRAADRRGSGSRSSAGVSSGGTSPRARAMPHKQRDNRLADGAHVMEGVGVEVRRGRPQRSGEPVEAVPGSARRAGHRFRSMTTPWRLSGPAATSSSKEVSRPGAGWCVRCGGLEWCGQQQRKGDEGAAVHGHFVPHRTASLQPHHHHRLVQQLVGDLAEGDRTLDAADRPCPPAHRTGSSGCSCRRRPRRWRHSPASRARNAAA